MFQVYANDLDSEENGNVSYYIERGDRQKQFSIDRKTGQITVAAPLDREEVSIDYNSLWITQSTARTSCSSCAFYFLF